MSEGELALWTRVLADDSSALAELFDLHEHRAFGHARRLLEVREDAKDAVSIAFFELWRKRRSVRLVDGSPLPWLLNTVAYSARNMERTRRRYRDLVQRAPLPSADREVVSADESGVLAALRRLPDREQGVIVLTVLEGFSERDTAQALGVPVGTVKSRLARAKARLRDQMQALGGS